MEREKFEKAVNIQSEIDLHISNRNALSYDVNGGCYIFFGFPHSEYSHHINVTGAFHKKIVEYIEQITEERITELTQQFKEL